MTQVIYIYTHTYIHTYIHTYTHTHTHTHIYIYIYIYIKQIYWVPLVIKSFGFPEFVGVGSITMRMHISYYTAVITRCSLTEIEIRLNYNYLYCGLMCIPMWPTRMTSSQWYAGDFGFRGSIHAHSITF